MGILVPEISDLPWQAVFRGALASQVRVWGGTGNFVLPLRADTKDSEVFWALVELLDPDWWGLYGGSHRELEGLSPPAYTSWRARVDPELAQWPADERARLLDEAHGEPLSEGSIPEDLHALLVSRGATLNHEGRMMLRGPLSSTGAPPYPSVDALELRSLPTDLLDVEFDGTPTLQLLLAAEYGLLSQDLREAIDDRGLRLVPQGPSSSASVMRRIYDMETQPGLGPFSVSEAGLGWYRPRPVVRDTLTLVAGEDAWDFSLAYALRRARTLAFWVPESAFGSGGERNLAHRALARLAERAGVPMVVTSVTDDAAASTLARALEPHRRSAVIQTASWRESLPQRSNRLLVRNRLGRPEAMFLDEGATPHLRTPIPDLSDDPANLRWMVDVEVRDWAPARHRSIVPRLLNASSPGDARVTKEGLAYEGLSSMILSGVPLEQLTVHPVLSPAPLLDQLQHVASLSQWTCEVSEKGQFALATANLLGGFAELCATLRDPDVAEILRAYVAGNGTAPGLALTDRRRYLSLDDFRALDLTVPADGRLETLRAQRLLQAGLVLKCGRCRHADWYRPRDADPTFECTRCATSQVPDREAWMGDPEPKWRYRLDEAVFQFVRHRGDLPALGLAVVTEQERTLEGRSLRGRLGGAGLLR